MNQTFHAFFLTLLILCSSTPGNSATIKGLVKYEGEVPAFKEIKMDADPICLTHHSTAIFPQTLVLGPAQEMGNVFVHITKNIPKGDYPVPATEVVIDQKGCMYDPHVVGARMGQTVKILNPDGTLHNVHATSKINPEFNVAMPKFRTEITQVFQKEEFMFPMKCDVHPWMTAWVSVMAHPFFSVTKTDGIYTLDNLPAGEYEVTAWHEKLGTQVQTVAVAEGESKDVNFTFSKPAK